MQGQHHAIRSDLVFMVAGIASLLDEKLHDIAQLPEALLMSCCTGGDKWLLQFGLETKRSFIPYNLN